MISKGYRAARTAKNKAAITTSNKGSRAPTVKEKDYLLTLRQSFFHGS
jgi:hypothetical protein